MRGPELSSAIIRSVSSTQRARTLGSRASSAASWANTALPCSSATSQRSSVP
ncbi:MAG: hypothetical protein U0168_08965 [Nannocystaceae bacterium]